MNRLLFFPEGYPDEDFRSIVYRYHIRSGNANMAETKKELFDTKTYKFWQFPRKLSTLLDRLPFGHNLTEEYFLLHTWFPLIRPFLSDERLTAVYNDIMNGNVSRSAGRISAQRQFSILSNEIRYCSHCMQEDFKEYGECYVHLSHQISFVESCSKHKIKLSAECLNCGKKFSKKESGILTLEPCCGEIELAKVTHQSRPEKLKNYLLDELIYFKNNLSTLDNNLLHSKLIILLNEKGYIDILGNIDKKRLMLDVVKFYQEDFLIRIGYSRSPYILTEAGLLNFLKPKQMSRFILLYFLVIIFLKNSLKEFLCKQETYTIPIPFGNGPWECFNEICPCYKVEKTITKCERTYINNSSFRGQFCCPICGFQYTRKWSYNGTENDQFTVTDMGHLWRIKVLELYHRGYNKHKIAKVLNSNPSTVVYFLNNLGTNLLNTKSANEIDSYKEKKQSKRGHYQNGTGSIALDQIWVAQAELAATSQSLVEYRKRYRSKVSCLIKTHHNIKRTDIRRYAKKEYMWLIKNDEEWFDSVLPPLKGSEPIIDYAELDIELISKVREAALNLYAENPPTQIKKTSILNKLKPKERNRINNLKEKLPNTLKELENLTESLDEYQVRNTSYLFFQLKNSGRCKRVTFDTFRNERKYYRNCKGETRKKIVKLLEELQEEN